ncbi:hypothetical protein L0F63_005263, partial [Massospora cicadina]
MFLLFYPALIGLAFVVYKLYALFSVPREIKDIPSVPLWGSLISMLRREPYDVRYERTMAPVLSKFGVARFWSHGKWGLMLSEPQHIKEVLTRGDTFLKRRADDEDLKTMLFGKTLGISNILNSDGEDWRRHRRFANPAFKKAWSPEMFAVCTDKLAWLIESKNGAPQDIQDLFRRLTLDVLGKGLFSYDFEAVIRGKDNYNLELYNDVMTAMFNPIFVLFPFLENWVPSRLISHQKSLEFRSFLRNIIRERKAQLKSGYDDLLSLMIKASLEDEDTVTEDDVDIQEKAREEVHAVLKGELRTPTNEELNEMPYIDCIIKESMRIVSTVPQLRRYCTHDVELPGGLKIPANTYVTLQLWKLHHDEEIYPKPFEFDPQRFSHSQGPQDAQWMAFGGGSRM